jgi:acetyl-CoA carboxylase biotin carboxyl carrier protein
MSGKAAGVKLVMRQDSIPFAGIDWITRGKLVSLSYKEVAEIIKVIDASACEEVILEVEGARLVIRRGNGTAGPATAGTPTSASAASAAAPAQSHTPAQSHIPAQSQPAAAPGQPAAGTEDGIVVRAPMVGTFYRCPSPDEPPFVEEGAAVKSGDPICLIEVMKLYTTIEATTDGTIVNIAAEDGALVEFNQPLFTIKPA